MPETAVSGFKGTQKDGQLCQHSNFDLDKYIVFFFKFKVAVNTVFSVRQSLTPEVHKTKS